MSTTMLIHETEMPVSASYQEALLWRLGAFRPSDRIEFERAFKTDAGTEAAIEAVTQFVARWEKADWLEDYSIERIGKWLAKSAPSNVYKQYVDWASQQATPARIAFLKGLQYGN